MMKRIMKRDGKIVGFNPNKIRNAIEQAMLSSGEGNHIYAKKVTPTVVEQLNKEFRDEVPHIEDVQDAVEVSLMKLSLFKTAKSYIRSEEHTSELQSRGHLVCRLLLEKKKNNT